MQARKATQQDLRLVFTHLAKRSVEEIALAEYTLPEAREVFRDLRKGGALWALEHAGDAIGLIGFGHEELPDGEPVISTYFIGREAFFEPSIPSVRFGRRFMREMQADYGNRPMVSMCWSTHPQTERWYTLMGYRLAETLGVQRNFVLDPVIVQTG